MSDLLLVLGNKNLSSWSLRPWLLLRHAGIPFEERVVLFEEPGWRNKIVALSPSRRVPALRHRIAGRPDLVVWDSLAIAEYVAEMFPDKQLWPEDRSTRAVARAACAEMHSGFAHLRNDLPMDVAARVAPQTRASETEADIARIVTLWTTCRDEHHGAGAFLFGRFSVADAMFAPVIWRFRTYGVPLSGSAKDYAETMLALPAMREWEQAAEAEAVAARTQPRGRTPDPTSAQHCFAVIFSSQHTDATRAAPADYAGVAAAMDELARRQPGFLGIESARNPDGFGITVSYWDSLDAITAWKAHPEHRAAQARGREAFYARYEIRVCSADRGYKYPAD
jgi:glutathione S-transferase